MFWPAVATLLLAAFLGTPEKQQGILTVRGIVY